MFTLYNSKNYNIDLKTTNEMERICPNVKLMIIYGNEQKKNYYQYVKQWY